MGTARTAWRVFVSVSRKSSYYNAAWDSPDMIIQIALDYLVKEENLVPHEEKPTYRLLAKERWHRIHIVFDIFNDTYESDKAHLLNQNDLPVITVYLSGSGDNDTRIISIASKALEEDINKQIRDVHDATGIGSQPPFIVDHANGNVPTYPNPRSLNRS